MLLEITLKVFIFTFLNIINFNHYQIMQNYNKVMNEHVLKHMFKLIQLRKKKNHIIQIK
jgi:hypothetical protein